MDSNILRFYFYRIRYLVTFTVLLMLGMGCQPPPPVPPPVPQRTQLQIRQIQTREYNKITTNAVIKAVIAALQDDGFIVSYADKDVGLITAFVDSYEVDDVTKDWVLMTERRSATPYQTTKRVEASATVQKYGDVVRVRINLLIKALTNAGGLVWSQPVYNAKVYQKLFAKVDKAVYLQKQNL